MALVVEREKDIRIGKPSMNDMPYDLGKRVVEQILNAPKPDYTAMDQEIESIEQHIREKRAVKR